MKDTFNRYAFSEEKIEEAIETYGKQVVDTVLMLVGVSDPDGAHNQLEDMGMYEEAECLEFLFFNHD
jgi:hypothetical protein